MPAFLSACMKDDELWDFERSKQFNTDRGLFIINEGNFMYGNASLSYYNMESGEIQNDIFFKTNALPLGDIAHSMTIRDSLGYIVINNSGRIYVINTRTFEYAGKITGLTSPRYIHFISEKKAYVTDLYSRSVAVVDPLSFKITGFIDVNDHQREFNRHSTELMVQYDKYIYTNCWSFDNKILVIDSETDSVVDSIEVLKQPNSMVLDKNSSLWILTDGGFEGTPYGYETPGLLRIDAGSDLVVTVFRFSPGELPSKLKINGTGDTLYFLNRHVYRQTVEPGSSPELFVRSPYPEEYSGGFYGLAVDPESSDIYVSDAGDYIQRGTVFRFRPDGFPLDTFQAGIVPGNFCFKR